MSPSIEGGSPLTNTGMQAEIVRLRAMVGDLLTAIEEEHPGHVYMLGILGNISDPAPMAQYLHEAGPTMHAYARYIGKVG